MIWTTMHVWHNGVPIDLIICNTNFFSLIKWQVKYDEVEKIYIVSFTVNARRPWNLKDDVHVFFCVTNYFFSLDICDKRLNFSVNKSLSLFCTDVTDYPSFGILTLRPLELVFIFFPPPHCFVKNLKRKMEFQPFWIALISYYNLIKYL